MQDKTLRKGVKNEKQKKIKNSNNKHTSIYSRLFNGYELYIYIFRKVISLKKGKVVFNFIKRKMKESKMRELERCFWIEDVYKKILFESENQEEKELVKELLEENKKQKEKLYRYLEKIDTKEDKK